MDAQQLERHINASLTTRADDVCERIPSVLVEPHERDAAERMLQLQVHDLGLPTEMRIAWFRSFNGPDDLLSPAFTLRNVATSTTGAYRFESHPFIVWVRAGIGAREVAATVAHESRHAWQYLKRGGPETDDPVARENDAYGYELKLVKSFQH